MPQPDQGRGEPQGSCDDRMQRREQPIGRGWELHHNAMTTDTRRGDESSDEHHGGVRAGRGDCAYQDLEGSCRGDPEGPQANDGFRGGQARNTKGTRRNLLSIVGRPGAAEPFPNGNAKGKGRYAVSPPHQRASKAQGDRKNGD